MRSYSLPSWAVLVLAGLPSALSAIAPNALPRFETIFYGEFELQAIDSMNATFGTRVDIALKGSVWTVIVSDFVTTQGSNVQR